MKFILKYLIKYKGLLILNIIAVLLIVTAEFGIPKLFADIINNGIIANHLTSAQKMSYITKIIPFFALVAVLGLIGNILINFCAARTSTYILRDIRNEVFEKTQTFSPTEFHKFGISSIITRTTTDVFQILNFVNIFYRSAVVAPIMIIVSVIMICMTAPVLGIGLFISVPIVIVTVIIITKKSVSLSDNQQKNLDNLNQVTRENITGVRVIRAFRKNEYESKRFADTNETYTKNSEKLFKLVTTTEPIFFWLLNIAVIFSLFVASYYIDLSIIGKSSKITIGNMVEFLDYQFHVLFSILTFSRLFVMFPRTMVSAARIKELYDTESIIKNPINPILNTEKLGTVSFDNVSFQYPDGRVPVIFNISFDAKKGDRIAFIGSTGSGKSTLINLIPRFYDVSTGSIKIDGVDVRDYDIKHLRSKIGFILQKALLFSGTIKENILHGNPSATDDEIIEAAKIAQAHNFIIEKNDGYEEYVSEGGSNLSGGQKQRISIARALVRKPEILIFDDSFSALDYKTDATLRVELAKHTKNSIVFIVAQRVSSIMDATKIIVLNEGDVVGIGKHKDLIKDCKIYREIAESQLSKEEMGL